MVLLALALLGGCRKVEPAPDDLEGLLHYLWRKQPEGTDAEIGEAVANLHDLLDAATLEENLDGSTAPLTDEEVALADLDREVSPEEAAGLYVVHPFPCELDTMEQILIRLDQDALYDIYDAYERTYTSDVDAYLDRDAPRLSWEVTYGTSVPFAGAYSADLAGQVRRVEDTEHGSILLSRTVLVEPATFDDPDPVFDQDYRVELHYAPRAGTLLHVEALWRHMKAGVVNTDSATVQRLILNGLEDWDDTTAQWCEDGLP